MSSVDVDVLVLECVGCGARMDEFDVEDDGVEEVNRVEGGVFNLVKPCHCPHCEGLKFRWVPAEEA